MREKLFPAPLFFGNFGICSGGQFAGTRRGGVDNHLVASLRLGRIQRLVGASHQRGDILRPGLAGVADKLGQADTEAGRGVPGVMVVPLQDAAGNQPGLVGGGVR